MVSRSMQMVKPKQNIAQLTSVIYDAITPQSQSPRLEYEEVHRIHQATCHPLSDGATPLLCRRLATVATCSLLSSLVSRLHFVAIYHSELKWRPRWLIFHRFTVESKLAEEKKSLD